VITARWFEVKAIVVLADWDGGWPTPLSPVIAMLPTAEPRVMPPPPLNQLA